MPKKIEKLNIKIYRGQPAVRFNPSEYKSVYRQYQTGVFRNLITMMKRAEADSHVYGCIGGRIAGFQKDWQFSPFEDNNKEDEKKAEWFAKIFDQFDMYNLLVDMQEAIMLIFNVFEFEWDIIDNYLAPIAHKKWDHKYFKYNFETGKFLIDKGRDGEEIPSHVLICHYKRKPVYMPVLRDFILKEFGSESWASFIETFGEPFILGRYPTGASQGDKDALDTAIENLARSARGAASKDTDVEFIETQRTTGDHEKFIEMCDHSISIAILGHANAVESSKGLQVGENLTQYQVRRDIAVADMMYIDAQMKNLTHLIYDLNWTDRRYPRFAMDKTPPLDVKEHRQNLELTFEMGYPVWPEDVRKLGIRVDADEEPRVKQPSLLDLGT